jgi:AbrB family looped-hinge helix DNA binding protein
MGFWTFFVHSASVRQRMEIIRNKQWNSSPKATRISQNGISDGIMVFMNAIVEIDKAGRIVVPKKLRDDLHLIPGTRLRIERERRPAGL